MFKDHLSVVEISEQENSPARRLERKVKEMRSEENEIPSLKAREFASQFALSPATRPTMSVQRLKLLMDFLRELVELSQGLEFLSLFHVDDK